MKVTDHRAITRPRNRGVLDAVRHVEGVVDVRDRVTRPTADLPKLAGIL
jgi:hypothetical protein